MSKSTYFMKRFALDLMRNFGLFACARVMSGSRARILMYHNFSGPGHIGGDAVNTVDLRRQLAYLRRHFEVVPLASIFERLKTGAPFHRLTVALTIDDGRRNCYEFLFPLLKEFGFPATFFVVSSFIRREDWIWTDKVLWLSERPSRPTELSAGNIDRLFANLSRLRPETRNAVIESMAKRMNQQLPREAPSQYAPCDWNELREMADSGLVEIGSHTVTHPIFSSLTEEESWHELTLSRAQIEDGMSRPVRCFCFPNGKPADYRLGQLQQVRDAGYAGAVVAHPGLVTNKADPFELPRLGVSGGSDKLSFSKDLDGVEHYQTKLLKSLRVRRDGSSGW